MAWTQADVDKLQQAIADGCGAKRIRFADQEVDFYDAAEMLQLLSVMRQELNAASSAGTPRTRYAAVGKGL